MNTRWKCILLALLAMLTLGLMPACELDSGSNTGSDATDDGTQGEVEEDVQGCADCLPYKFVRIDDLSEFLGGEDPGADIDAIELVKADGTNVFASAIPHFSPARDVDAMEPREALGAPDAFPNYPSDGSVESCQLWKDQEARDDKTYASLGGPGGYMIVEMPDAIESGDTLRVFEVGGCTFINSNGDAGEARLDAVKVQVSVSSEPDGNTWIVVTDTGTGPIISGTVPQLQDVRP